MNKSIIGLALSLLVLTGCGFSLEQDDLDTATSAPSAEEIMTQFGDQSVTAFTQDDELYFLVPEESEFFWRGEKITGAAHEGLMLMDSGTLTFENDQLTGSFVVDMTNMVTTDLEGDGADSLIKHLQSEDFFAVEQFPTAEFTINTSQRADGNKFSLNGDLTIKGITKPITFDANFLVLDGRTIGLADITIDRTEWDIRYGSGKFFEGLGDKMIKDEMNIRLTLSFISEPDLAAIVIPAETE